MMIAVMMITIKIMIIMMIKIVMMIPFYRASPEK